MIKGQRLRISEKDLNEMNGLVYTDGSKYFRERCIKAGYRLTELYPIYHHGWEMDEWAANATKDGKKWWVTTDHGRLMAEEVPRFSLKRFVLGILGKI